MVAKINIAVLVSGSGTNLQALIDAARDPAYPARITLVISNKPQAGGLIRANDAGIPTEIVLPSDFKTAEPGAYEHAIHNLLREHEIDLVCLAGFMKILGPELISRWEGRILNIHPSLLPKFGGPGMYGDKVHRAVIRRAAKESGASVHIVTEECDEGPVIAQKAIPVYDFDTADSLAERVLAVEHQIYPQAVREKALLILEQKGAAEVNLLMGGSNSSNNEISSDSLKSAQDMWGNFVSFGKLSVVAVCITLVLMAIFLL